MEVEDETPIVENREFDYGVEPMMTSMRTMTPTRSSSDDSSDDTGSADNSTQSSAHSVEKGWILLSMGSPEV
jgi:hypothetical protein